MVFYSSSLAERFRDPAAAPLEPCTELRRETSEGNNLVTTFMISAALVLLIGMLLFGTWVTQRSTEAVLQHSAHSAAVFMDSSIEPLVQELADLPQLSASAIEAIDKLLTHGAISKKLNGIVIWRRDGTIAYAKNRDLIGRTELVTAGLAAALNGEVEIEQLGPNAGIVTEAVAGAEGSYKIYSPMHKLGTTEVIAAAGYVEPPHQLDNLLSQGRRDTWIVVGIFTALIFGLTFNLIHHASEMIKDQNHDLRERYAAQVRLNLQNELLRKELQDAHSEGIAINEKFLRRIGADLHDGPAQFLALALLRLDDITARSPAASSDLKADAEEARRAKAIDTVRSATQNALSEIRSISTGLALPEIKDRSSEDVIGLAINAFVAATQTKVTCELGPLPEQLPLAWTVCLFRFVQEGLSNGYRHAAGTDQSVRARCVEDCLQVEVADRGPGFDAAEAFSKTSRLGLLGLRHRIESLGGSFHIASVRGDGTTITLSIPLSQLDDPQ